MVDGRHSRVQKTHDGLVFEAARKRGETELSLALLEARYQVPEVLREEILGQELEETHAWLHDIALGETPRRLSSDIDRAEREPSAAEIERASRRALLHSRQVGRVLEDEPPTLRLIGPARFIFTVRFYVEGAGGKRRIAKVGVDRESLRASEICCLPRGTV